MLSLNLRCEICLFSYVGLPMYLAQSVGLPVCQPMYQAVRIQLVTDILLMFTFQNKCTLNYV